MRKFTLLSVCFLLALANSFAEEAKRVLLNEEFEQSFPPAGWSVKNGDASEMHWGVECFNNIDPQYLQSYILSAGCCAEISSNTDTPLQNEWLITKNIVIPADMEHTQLSFMWACNKVYSVDNDTYDVKVKVSEDDGNTWTVIWAEDDQTMIENSYVTWPWPHFGHLTSKIDISAYKGKTIKVAFNYVGKESDIANTFRLDAVKVQEYTPMSSPIIGGAPGNYAFKKTYVGQNIFSGNNFQIVNNGIGKLTITAIEGLEGTDFSTDLKPEEVSLDPRQSKNFGIYYNPTKDGKTETDLKIKTNGGDFICHISAVKEQLSQGYSVESFESETFPPAGWTKEKSGWKKGDFHALSGKSVARCHFHDDNPTLMTPRLNMSTGNHKFTFFYREDGSNVNENSTYVKFSKDGGNTWQKIKTLVCNNSVWEEVTVDLGEPESDNCYIKFEYSLMISGWDTECGASFIDDVILPPLWQEGSAPVASQNPDPINDAANQNISVILRWDPVLMADNYKINIGTSKDDPTDVVSGLKITDATEYMATNLKYSTKYYWQVIPENEHGKAENCPVWSFSTFDDPTIKVFPYFMGFENNSKTMPPMGWVMAGERKWLPGEVPFQGNVCARTVWGAGEAILQMPPIELPSDKDMQIAFYWKDANIYPENRVGKTDTTFFEISEDNGKNWKRVDFLSTSKPMTEYVRVKYSLADYKGKSVIVRWRDWGSGNEATGTGLDNIDISELKSSGNPYIVNRSWSAGRHNYHVNVQSGDIFRLFNDGTSNLTITKAEFSNANFSTNLDSENLDLAPGAHVDFGFKFKPVESGIINTTYTLTFNSGDVIEIKLDGHSNPSDVRYYSFEENDDFVIDIPPFILKDVDRHPTVKPIMTNYDNIGSPFAYIVMNHKKTFYNAYPKTGDKVLMSLTVQTDGEDCNDWLITPKAQAKDGAKFTFWAKSYTDQFKLSQFNVLVSETNDKIGSFKVLEDGKLLRAGSDEWEEFSFDLSAYAGKDIHIAIQNVTEFDGFIFMVDDVEMSKFIFSDTPNNAPEFTSTAVTKATVGEEYVYNVVATDSDNDNLTIELDSDITWLTLTEGENGKAKLSGTPADADKGVNRVVLSVTDGVQTIKQEFDINVTVAAATNNAPEFTSTAVVEAEENKEYIYNITVTDADNDNITITLENDIAWLKLTAVDNGKAKLSGTPVKANIGTHSVVVVATDGKETVKQTFDIKVKEGKVLGINDNTQNVSIYPNPASTVINIEGVDNAVVSVYNTNGVMVIKEQNTNRLNVSGLSTGMYIVKIQTSDYVITRKLNIK
jgi:hypothetical protein